MTGRETSEEYYNNNKRNDSFSVSGHDGVKSGNWSLPDWTLWKHFYTTTSMAFHVNMSSTFFVKGFDCP
jgi:hypothetical protein